MDSNTHSTGPADGPTAPVAVVLSAPVRADRPTVLVGSNGLAGLAAAVEGLAAEDLDGLSDVVLAEQVLELRRLVDRLEGQWLRTLAVADGRGAAGADQGVQAPSTAGWLRARLRLGAGAAKSWVRTARALYRGPLTGTAEALAAGGISAAHAQVLAQGIQDLPAQVAAEAEPVLLEVAGRVDPPRLRRAVAHLRWVADPDAADALDERRHLQRRLWLSPTLDGMVAVDGLLAPEAGQTLLAALEPLARPTSAEDARSGAQRRADALAELCRRQLEAGRLPQTGGVRPQLLVTVELASLLDGSGVSGQAGGADGAALAPEACRRLACDGAVTRVLVTRQPVGDRAHGDDPGRDHPDHALPGPRDHPDHSGHDPTYHHHDQPDGSGGGLAGRLRAAVTLLPPVLGGAPTMPLEVGRASRVVTPAQRSALVVRDGGCVVGGCGRPPAWCEAHHLLHWLDGGRTDLENLALVCRAHHRAVHEGGWRLARDADGRLGASPPHRRSIPRHRRRHPTSA
jgi:Domain of unknown function (DUF222)/HNH endonuclease